TLVTASTDAKARLWSVPGGQLEKTFTGPATALNGVAISPDAKTIVAVSSGINLPGDNPVLIAGGQLWQWQRDTGKQTSTDLGLRSGNAVAFVSDQQVAIGAGRDVLLVDLQRTDATKEPHKLWSHSRDVLAVAVSQDGRMVASGSVDRSADVINVSTEQLAYR